MGENVHLKKKQKKNKTTGCCKQTVIIWPLQQCIRVPSNGKKNIDNILLLIENKVETSRLKPTSFFFFFLLEKKVEMWRITAVVSTQTATNSEGC